MATSECAAPYLACARPAGCRAVCWVKPVAVRCQKGRGGRLWRGAGQHEFARRGRRAVGKVGIRFRATSLYSPCRVRCFAEQTEGTNRCINVRRKAGAAVPWAGGVVRRTSPACGDLVHHRHSELHMARSRMLTKWFSSTRLETRTKESNIYASIGVRQTLDAQ